MINNLGLALMTGVNIPIPELSLTIHQPSIKEISMLGEFNFFFGAQTLCITKKTMEFDEDLEQMLEEATDFQIFMLLINQKEMGDKKGMVQNLMTLLFPDKKAIFTPQSILMTEPEKESVVIDESNFNILQDYVQEILCMKSSMNDQATFNPADKKAAEIAKKLMKGRERVSAQKGDDNGSILGRYTSCIAVGLQISLEEAEKYTIYQLYDQIQRFSLHTSWDLNIKTRLAGGKPDDQPEDWMKNIH